MACCGHSLWAQAVPESLVVTPARQAALDAITASSLQGHLSFLASDLLEGRDSPSRGLDIAAEYIAAQFRRAGLKPAGTDGYFQIARWKVVEADAARFRLEFKLAGMVHPVALDQVRVSATGPLEIAGAPLVRLGALDEAALKAIDRAQAEGRGFVFELKPTGQAEPGAQRQLMESVSKAVALLGEAKAAALVILDRREPGPGMGLPRGRLIDPESPAPRPAGTPPRRMPVLTVQDPAVINTLANAASLENATLTLALGAPVERPATLRNVAGLLPGSDPVLKNEYVIVSAHYDHIGVTSAASLNDHVFNGANDDASGTTMVVELAAALSRLETKPKRSILFLTFFGEEKGLLGSRYYGRHPLVPLKDTAAMLNLEQVGRTDDSEGPSLKRASMTGFDFSEVGTVLQRAGSAVGVEVVKHPKNSDLFFGRSDNQSLADSGVPAHTLCTAFMFPDYHQEGDHWEQIDYVNMAHVGQAVGLGVMELADSPTRPLWNEANVKTERYVKAWKALHQAAGGASPKVKE